MFHDVEEVEDLDGWRGFQKFIAEEPKIRVPSSRSTKGDQRLSGGWKEKSLKGG